MQPLDRFLDLTASTFKVLVAFCLLTMLSINAVNIFWRGAFGQAFGWVFSWTLLLFVWMVLLGFFVYVRTRRDVQVHIFVTRMPYFIRLFIAIAGNIVGIMVMLAILRAAPDLFRLQRANMEAIRLPIFVRSAPLFISAAFVMLHFVNEIVALLRGRSRPFDSSEHDDTVGAVE